MTVAYKIISLLILFFCFSNSESMRRIAPSAHIRRNMAKSSIPLRLPVSRPRARNYSNSPDQMLKTIERQIKQCQISEQEYLEEYSSWDSIMIDCLWNGKCRTGKCNNISNCVLNRQMAYLAWQHAQKETVFHEYARIIAVLDNTKKN